MTDKQVRELGQAIGTSFAEEFFRQLNKQNPEAYTSTFVPWFTRQITDAIKEIKMEVVK